MTAKDKVAALRRAVTMLKKREYCAAQLFDKLAAHYPLEIAAAAIDELERCDLLNDERVARVYVRSRNKDGGQWGREHIAKSLSQFGVSDEVAQAAMDAELDKDETTRAAEVLAKKYPNPKKDAKTIASMARFLSARGFDEQTIRQLTVDSCQLTDDN